MTAIADAAASAVLGPEHAAMYPQPESHPLREAVVAVVAENLLWKTQGEGGDL